MLTPKNLGNDMTTYHPREMPRPNAFFALKGLRNIAPSGHFSGMVGSYHLWTFPKLCAAITGLSPRTPIFGFPMKAGDGNDDNPQFPRLGQGFIDDTIRESTHLASTNVSSKWLPRRRKIFDTLDSFPSLIPEFVAKPGSLRIVVTNRLPEFAPRR